LGMRAIGEAGIAMLCMSDDSVLVRKFTLFCKNLPSFTLNCIR
jgi:hypothetical protein